MSWTSPQICYVPIRSPGDGGGSKGRKTEWGKRQKLYSTKVPKQNTKKVQLKATETDSKLKCNSWVSEQTQNRSKLK